LEAIFVRRETRNEPSLSSRISRKAWMGPGFSGRGRKLSKVASREWQPLNPVGSCAAAARRPRAWAAGRTGRSMTR
jgi:hypothetical protein